MPIKLDKIDYISEEDIFEQRVREICSLSHVCTFSGQRNGFHGQDNERGPTK